MLKDQTADTGSRRRQSWCATRLVIVAAIASAPSTAHRSGTATLYGRSDAGRELPTGPSQYVLDLNRGNKLRPAQQLGLAAGGGVVAPRQTLNEATCSCGFLRL